MAGSARVGVPHPDHCDLRKRIPDHRHGRPTIGGCLGPTFHRPGHRQGPLQPFCLRYPLPRHSAPLLPLSSVSSRRPWPPGYVIRLLHANIPLYWAIKSNKLQGDDDFYVNSKRVGFTPFRAVAWRPSLMKPSPFVCTDPPHRGHVQPVGLQIRRVQRFPRRSAHRPPLPCAAGPSNPQLDVRSRLGCTGPTLLTLGRADLQEGEPNLDVAWQSRFNCNLSSYRVIHGRYPARADAQGAQSFGLGSLTPHCG